MQFNQKERFENPKKNLAGQLWFKYNPYWPLFLILLLLTIGGAWLYLKYATPLYESSASVLIIDEKKGIDNPKISESLNELSSNKIIENEVEVIQSRTLMNRVVNILSLYAPVYEETRIKAASAYVTSPIKIQAFSPDSITEYSKIPFDYDYSTSEVILNKQRYPLNIWVKTIYGQLKFLKNNATVPNRKPVLFFSLIKPKIVTSDLLADLQVSSSNKLSSVIEIKIRDAVPKRGEDILNELLQAYNEAEIRDKNLLAENTMSFVQERLNRVARELDSIELKLQHYKSNKGAIDIGSQGKLFLQNVSDNDQKLGDINMQLAVLDQVENYVKSKDNKGGIVPSTLGIDDPLLGQLLDKLYNYELQYEKLRNTTAENNPLLLSISDQIDKIKPSIMENIQSQKRSLQVSKNNLHSTNGNYSSLLQTIPQKERELVEINREQTIKSNLYNFLLEKRENAALSNSSNIADNRIIDHAESTFVPVSPNKKAIYLLAIMAAFALGILLINGKEAFSRKILYRSEIEKLTSFPIIGEIPYEKTKEQIVIRNGKNTIIAEQFRKLRTTIAQMKVSSKIKKILVTSSISGDGKSFTSANLGSSFALAGKKVILLELDLNNPSLANKLNVNSERGIADYLLSKADIEEIIVQTDIHPNLYVIPSGSLPENPSELIMSERVGSLIGYLEDKFDYIFIDSAPVGSLSDAYILSNYCDLSLYIIRHGFTPKVLIEHLDMTNEINELKNLNIVFNGVRSRGFSKSTYGYGYAYIYKQKARERNKTYISES